jgi:hypothetical protein
LIFAQNGATPPTNFDITNNGDGTTSISAALSVSITALDGPLVPPPITDAVFGFSSTSTSAASTFSAGITFLVERFSGNFFVDAPEYPWTRPSPYRKREILQTADDAKTYARPMPANARAILIDALRDA